jgi:hypothetical protein
VSGLLSLVVRLDPFVEIPVNQKALVCCLLLICPVSSAVAQNTKTYSEAQCKYTLPGPEWEWLDPQLAPQADAKCLALAKNQDGVGFTLRFQPLAGEKPTAKSFESFETGFIKGGQMKKLDGKQISFKGISAYQIDAEMPGRIGTSIRIMYANDCFYALQVINALGPLAAAESDPVFQGFDFVNQPQPIPMDPAFERGQAIGRGIGSLLCMGAVVLAVVFLFKKRRSRPNAGTNGPTAQAPR